MTIDVNLQSLPNGIALAIALQIDCPKYLEENTISLPPEIKLALENAADIVKRSVETVENVVKIPDKEVKEHAMEAANYAANTGLKALEKTVNGATQVVKNVAKRAVEGAAISLAISLANVDIDEAIDDALDTEDGDDLLALAAGAAIGLSALAVGAAAGATVALAECTVEVTKNTGAAILKDIKSAATVLDDMPLAMYGAALDLLFKKYAVNKDVTKEDAINACKDREALKPMIPQTPWSKLYGGLKDIVSGKTCEELYLKKGASELFYSTFVYGNNEMCYKRLFANTLTKKLGKEVRPEAITTELLTSFVKYCEEHTCKDNSAIHEFYIHENSENANSPMAGELSLKPEL